MQRKYTMPDGRVATYDDVPITVTEEGLRQRAMQDYPEAFKNEKKEPSTWTDLAKSAWGGLVKGGLEGMDAVYRKAPVGLAMMGLDALGQQGAIDSLTQYHGKRDERLNQVVTQAGGNYKPQSDTARYTNAATQGVGGAIGTGPTNLWQTVLGGVTGLGMQGAADANLGPAAQLAIAFGLPLGAATARRTLFPKLGYDEVQAAMGIPKRPWYAVGPDKPMRDARDQFEAGMRNVAKGEQQGVTLLPAQGIQGLYAPQSGIINLQNRITPTTAGATHLKPALDAQAAQAQRLVDDVLQMARESGKYQTDLDAAAGMYAMLRGQPLTAGQRQQVVSALRNSPLYETRGTDQQKYLQKLIDMLENQGSATVPGGQQVTTTQVQAGRQQVPLIGVQNVPPHQVQLPASTQGQLLDIRGQASKGFPDTPGIGQAQRAEARTALNQGRSPNVEAVDAQFGPATDKANFVQHLEESAAGARNTNADLTGGTGADFARRVRGAPGSTDRQEWFDALNPVQFEQPDTAHRISQALDLLERTGYGRSGVRSIDPHEYGQARASAASMGTAAAGLSGSRRLLAIIPGMREKLMTMETDTIAKALADPSGRKLSTLLNYNPNDEMARNILLSMGIGYGLKDAPTGE